MIYQNGLFSNSLFIVQNDITFLHIKMNLIKYLKSKIILKIAQNVYL